MAAAIGPGDWVECVDARAHARPKIPPVTLIKGRLYRVVQVIPAGRYPGLRMYYEQDSLRVEDDPLPVPFAWRVVRFRPIYRPRADFIESLKAPPILAPVRESEPA